MSATVHAVESPGDAELISAVRGGDVDAYGELFERHAGAARRLARQLVSAGDVEDLVSEAFIKVLTVLQRGGGPDVAFRAYLLTAVRRLRIDRLRAGSKLQTTDEIEMFDPGVPFRDTAVEGFESAAAARAFASLPERWQLVLWHTEVEGAKPAEVATLLGMTPNSVSALAYRAREGLRQAFLAQHAAEVADDDCRWTHQHLGGYIRHGISRRDAAKVEGHLGDCRKCMAIYLELTEVNDNLAGILAPLLLGGVAAAYLSAGSVAAPAGVLALLGHLKETLGANATTAAVAGVATAGLVAGGAFLALRPIEQVGEERPGATPSESTAAAAEGRRTPAPRRQPPPPATQPTADDAAAVGAPPAPTPAPAAADPAPASPAPPAAPAEPQGGARGEDEAPQGGPQGGPKEEDAPPDKDPPDRDPPAEDPPPPAADLAVEASFARVADLPVGRLSVSVSGVTESASLVVTGSGIRAMTTQDDRCSGGPDGTITCRLAGDGDVGFEVTAPLGGSITVTVSSPAPDADSANNSASVEVGAPSRHAL